MKPSKKITLRHYKKISEFINHEKNPDEDVLVKLRQYRRLRSKFASSVKESFSAVGEKNGFSASRPSSANQTNKIFSALKSQELSPLKLNSNLIQLEQSVDRLYRGSRPTNKSIDLQNTPLFQLAEVISEDKQKETEDKIMENDKEMNKNLLTNLVYLSSLQFELGLNREIVRNKELSPPEKPLGIFYTLQEKMVSKLDINSIKDCKLDYVTKELKGFSRLFRDILRGIASKNCEEEGIMIEMLWTILMKFIDDCISIHEYSLNSVIESTRSHLRFISEDYKKKFRSFNDASDTKISELEKEISELNNKILILTKEKTEVTKNLNDKSRILTELTEIESQEKACVELRSLLVRLSSYITESETEQTKQASTLNRLSFMIKTSDLLQKKPDFFSIETQTVWEISESYLEELNKPIVSRYPLFSILIKNVKVPPKLNAISLCNNALENCDGQLSYFKELLIFLMSLYKEKDNIIEATRGIYYQLLQTKTPASQFYLGLLNHSQPCYLKIEQTIFKLNLLFIKKFEDTPVTIPKFLEFLYTYLNEEKEFCEEVLEIACKVQGFKDVYNVLLYRFQLAVEKLGKGFKNLYESDTISVQDFSEWAKSKVGWLVSNNDLETFLKNHSVSISISTLVNENAIPDRIKELEVEKESFLFACLDILYRNHALNLSKYEELANLHDFQVYKDIFVRISPDLTDKRLMQSFAEIITSTPIQDVIESILDYKFVDLKITESIKPKKKSAKQSKKPKK